MNKHLLVTVSEDYSAMHGLRFVGHFLHDKQDIKITLFLTAPSPSPTNFEPAANANPEAEERQFRLREQRSQSIIAKAQEILTRFGFSPDQIDSKLVFSRRSKVTDIAQEAQQGLYDAVVLGRRGVSWLEEALGESVTRGLLEETLSFPFWICRKPDAERRNVLLCVDGSPPSMRMADHVGFMLSTQEAHEVTLFRIVRPNAVSRRAAESIFEECRLILLDNGVAPEQINVKVAHESNVAHSILHAAEQGRYAAVAIGRTGVGGGLINRLFMGSASSTLFRELTGAGLWVCH
jgi:nucleotide-binding universal stress UspA family protein